MSDLKTLIDDQRMRAAATPKVDWTKRRDKWLKELDSLYGRIEQWLRDAGLQAADLVRGERKISEDTLGAYVAPTLSVQLPTAKIDFTPVGSVIIGGLGRVDVTVESGHRKFYLIAFDADKDELSKNAPSYVRDWGWRTFEPGNPRAQPVGFDEQGLAAMLAKLSQ